MDRRRAGPDEDACGEPLTGRSGELLDRIIEAMGLSRDAVFLTNTVLCQLDEARHLRKRHVAACRRHVEPQIIAGNLRVIVPLGNTAWRWFQPRDKRKMADVRGRVYTRGRRVLAPTYHPAFLLRQPGYERDVWTDVQKVTRILREGTDATETLTITGPGGVASIPTAEAQSLFG